MSFRLPELARWKQPANSPERKRDCSGWWFCALFVLMRVWLCLLYQRRHGACFGAQHFLLRSNHRIATSVLTNHDASTFRKVAKMVPDRCVAEFQSVDLFWLLASSKK